MLFHLAWSISFGVLAWETTFLLVEIFQEPITNFHFKVFQANTHSEQNGPHHVKEHEKLCLKMVSEIVCIFVCGHLSLWKDVPSKVLDMGGHKLFQSFTSNNFPQKSQIISGLPSYHMLNCFSLLGVLCWPVYPSWIYTPSQLTSKWWFSNMWLRLMKMWSWKLSIGQPTHPIFWYPFCYHACLTYLESTNMTTGRQLYILLKPRKFKV